MKKNKFDIIHYFSLAVILSAGFILFFLSSGFPQRQYIITAVIAFSYIFWGIIHHSLKGDLHPRIVIEYSLIALLSVVIVRGILLR